MDDELRALKVQTGKAKFLTFKKKRGNSSHHSSTLPPTSTSSPIQPPKLPTQELFDLVSSLRSEVVALRQLRATSTSSPIQPQKLPTQELGDLQKEVSSLRSENVALRQLTQRYENEQIQLKKKISLCRDWVVESLAHAVLCLNNKFDTNKDASNIYVRMKEFS